MLNNVDEKTTRFFNRAIDLDINKNLNTDDINTPRDGIDPLCAGFQNAEFFSDLTDDEADAFRLNVATIHYACYMRFVQLRNKPFDDEHLTDLYEKIQLVMPYCKKASKSFDTDREELMLASPWHYLRKDPAEITLLYATFCLETAEASAESANEETKRKINVLAEQAVRLLNMRAADARYIIRGHLFSSDLRSVS